MLLADSEPPICRRQQARRPRSHGDLLVLNGTEIDAAVDDQERLMLDLAAGRIERVHLTDWLRHHLRRLG